MSDIRELITQHANMAIGYGYPHPLAHKLLYPNDPEALAKQAAKTQSSCALTALAIWRAVGVDHPALSDPYLDYTGPARIGNAVVLVKQIAIDHGAWVDCIKYNNSIGLPEPGDVVLIGNNGRADFGGVEHVFIVTRINTLDSFRTLVHSVDGGQPGIEPRTRLATQVGDALRFYALGYAKYRTAQGWARADRLRLLPQSGPYDQAA